MPTNEEIKFVNRWAIAWRTKLIREAIEAMNQFQGNLENNAETSSIIFPFWERMVKAIVPKSFSVPFAQLPTPKEKTQYARENLCAFFHFDAFWARVMERELVRYFESKVG